MQWTPIVRVSRRRWVAITLAALLLPSVLYSDVIVGEDHTIYGKVLRVDSQTVKIARLCNRNDITVLDRTDVRHILFDSDCGPHELRLPTGGLALCETARVPVQRVYFKNFAAPVFAGDILLEETGRVRILLAGDGGSLTGPGDTIHSILEGEACPAAFQRTPAFPSSFCLEPTQWAVNWSLEPIYNNSIFTKGFSVYLDPIGVREGAVAPESIQQAFGIALLSWTSALFENRQQLDSELQGYLDSVLGRSERALLLTAPSVILVRCPENASFVVKSFREPSSVFAESEYVAKAQLQGRTILLNEVDHQLRFDLTMRELVKDGSVNLTTVFTHELGHSFGLGHIEDESSVMNSEAPARSPTPSDAIRLATLLKQSVAGTRAGEFNPTECTGLRVKYRKR